MTWRRPPRTRDWHSDRVRLLAIGFGLFGLGLAWRLFSLQIIQHGLYAALADDQHQFSEQLIARRGEVLVRDGTSNSELYPLATNRTLFLLFAIPKQIKDPLNVVEKLKPLITLDEETLKKRLSKENDLYEPIEHGLTDEQKKSISDLKLPGLYFEQEATRYYPEQSIGGHLLGFLGFDENKQIGRYGIEGYHEKTLAGSRGYIKAEKDAGGQLIATAAQYWQPAVDGSDLILTIDRTVQFEACRKLDEAVQKHGADSGSLVILDPKTGAVVAMCGSPSYDPNNYRDVKDIARFVNPVTQVPYEPGSVFKPITMAAALNDGQVTPETTYTDTGEVKVGSYTIRNSDLKSNGVQTMTEVLEKSLNTGAIYAMNKIGAKRFEQYVKAFGFGQATGIDLDEREGNIATLDTGREIYATTASFGQGITVTPLQLASAYAVLANGGKLMRPYVVERERKADGTEQVTEPRMIRQVITPKASATISAMLVRVVQNGHGQRAGVSGYFVAGKTGTAQIPDPKTGEYHPDQTIGTFAGFAPVEDPKFVMVAQVVRPRDVQFAESSAAPLFGEIAQFLLLHYGISPTDSGAQS